TTRDWDFPTRYPPTVIGLNTVWITGTSGPSSRTTIRIDSTWPSSDCRFTIWTAAHESRSGTAGRIRIGPRSRCPDGWYTDPKASAKELARGWNFTKSQPNRWARSTVIAARSSGDHSSRYVWPHAPTGGLSATSIASAVSTRRRPVIGSSLSWTS